MGLSLVAVFLYAGRCRPRQIVGAQKQLWFVIPAFFVPRLRHHDGRRDQPVALRPGRGRGRDRRWLPHRIRLDALRDVLPRRVHQHVHRLGPGHDDVPRRVAGAAVASPRSTTACSTRLVGPALVHHQGLAVHVHVRLAARLAASRALRPVHAASAGSSSSRSPSSGWSRRLHPRPPSSAGSAPRRSSAPSVADLGRLAGLIGRSSSGRSPSGCSIGHPRPHAEAAVRATPTRSTRSRVVSRAAAARQTTARAERDGLGRGRCRFDPHREGGEPWLTTCRRSRTGAAPTCPRPRMPAPTSPPPRGLAGEIASGVDRRLRGHLRDDVPQGPHRGVPRGEAPDGAALPRTPPAQPAPRRPGEVRRLRVVRLGLPGRRDPRRGRRQRRHPGRRRAAPAVLAR
jgi:hypothetical protein